MFHSTRFLAVLVVLVVLVGVDQLQSAPVQWSFDDGGNGHFYEFVAPQGGITWTSAKTASEERMFLATPGHLATVTSQGEWDFLLDNFPTAYNWIGLSDVAQEGHYEWVTGEPFEFSTWKRNEPNNAGNEDYVHYDGGGWNDFHNWNTVYSADFPHHYIVEYSIPELFSVLIDIKPDGDKNPINLKSKGVLPVAILGTDEFDALQVDWESVMFGDPLLIDDGGTAVGPTKGNTGDVNDDGLMDLKLFFSVPELVDNGAFDQMSEEAILTGALFDGTEISGNDVIHIVPHDNSLTRERGIIAVAAVPEPSTIILLLTGALGFIAYNIKRRQL